MQLSQPFDATKVDPSQGTGQLPIGTHKVIITNEKEKAASSGKGTFLELTLEIIEGPNAGRSGAHRLNLKHESETTMRIAYQQLSAICHAIGKFNIINTVEIQKIPFMVKVIQSDDERYTEVDKILDINGNEPRKGQAPGQQSQAVQQNQQQSQPAQQTQAPSQDQPTQNAWQGQQTVQQEPQGQQQWQQQSQPAQQTQTQAPAGKMPWEN